MVDTIIRAIYPSLLLLWYTDQAVPTMDKLYYYVQKVEESLRLMEDKLNRLDDLYTEIEAPKETIDDYVAQPDDDDSDYSSGELDEEDLEDDD